MLQFHFDFEREWKKRQNVSINLFVYHIRLLLHFVHPFRTYDHFKWKYFNFSFDTANFIQRKWYNFPALWPPFLDDKSRWTMINHADRFIATSLYKTREEKEATGWKYKRTFDRDEIFVVRWKVSSGDWNCHVVLIWKRNYCIAGVAGNRLFLALSFHTFAAICQIVEILALRKSLGKSLNLRAIALSLP